MSTPKVIALTYELRSGNAEGEVIETAGKEKPAEFLFGAGNLIPEFEDQIHPLDAGESFEFTIASDKAYGPVNPSAVVDLPRNIFTIDGKEAEDLLFEGNIVPMRNDKGDPLQGKILEIHDETVKMDFNHPLAGQDLHFKGEVLTSREANPEEIEKGNLNTGEENQ